MVQGRRYNSLLGTYSVFPLHPVGRCEGLIQLKNSHCHSAWPTAAKTSLRAYLHPNVEFVLTPQHKTCSISTLQRKQDSKPYGIINKEHFPLKTSPKNLVI